MIYEIKGDPIAWKSHKGFGRKSFNPHYKEKKEIQWELSLQHEGRPLYKNPLRIDFYFEVRIPISFSKKLYDRIKWGKKLYCTKRPDCTNYRKFIEDCLTGVVIEDDNLVVTGLTEKYYSRERPRTLIVIEEINYASEEGKVSKGD